MRARALCLWIGGAIAGLVVSACGGTSSAGLGNVPFVRQSASSGSPIKHIIIIVQENRSFDDFFARFPGADGATHGKMKWKVGGKYVVENIELTPHGLIVPNDLQHCHTAFLTDFDKGKNDGFGLSYRGVCPGGTMLVGKQAYQYVKQSDIQPYWDMAEQWVLGDHMFQTQGSGSFTAHQDLVRGGTQIDSKHSLVDNPRVMPWGCDSGPKSVTSLITKSGGYLKLVDQGPFPCTNAFPGGGKSYKTMRDLLDNASISWKYYSPCFGQSNTPGCNSPCETCGGALLNAFDVIYPVRNGPEWGTNVSMPETNIFDDITGGSLPAISWVIPEDDSSDHPGEPVDNGPSWVASVVNAVGASSYWNSSAIVVLWDDWGGMYDHVPPQQLGWGGLGFRVPFLVISPYAKSGSSSQGGYVSSTPYEFGSILKFIENNWNLGTLGTSDKRAASIGDVFDYSQQPRKFKTIGSKRNIEYFKTRPQTPQYGDPE